MMWSKQQERCRRSNSDTKKRMLLLPTRQVLKSSLRGWQERGSDRAASAASINEPQPQPQPGQPRSRSWSRSLPCRRREDAVSAAMRHARGGDRAAAALLSRRAVVGSGRYFDAPVDALHWAASQVIPSACKFCSRTAISRAWQ